MTKSEVVDMIARAKLVEELVTNITHVGSGADVQDLIQEIYLALLTTDESKIIDLYVNGQIRFFIARVIINQYFSSKSPFYIKIKSFRNRIAEIIVTDDDEGDNDSEVERALYYQSRDADAEKEKRRKASAATSVLFNKLSQADRTIFLLYVQERSLRKVGAILGVSHLTIRREIFRIREIIKKEFYKYEQCH